MTRPSVLLTSSLVMLWLLLLLSVEATAAAISKEDKNGHFKQFSNYSIEVSLDNWSNYDTENGGCVTCPYTCVKRTTGPTGTSLNLSNATLMASLPAIYSQNVMNGCCYAPKSKTTQQPDCNQEASPASAEACGFLYGPTLKWRIANASNPPEDAVSAILMASIDCENFWAVGHTPVKYTENTKAVSGSKQINGGCYGDAKGASMVLAGCLTSQLKFDKRKTYSWDQLAAKCQGLAGKCVMTNGLWGQQLKCCTKSTARDSDWDLQYKLYRAKMKIPFRLSGPLMVAVVFGGVALVILIVHVVKKARERARQTAFMREQEASDDYDAIMTPLVGGRAQGRLPGAMPASMDVSLHEGDEIFRPPEEELLFEADLY